MLAKILKPWVFIKNNFLTPVKDVHLYSNTTSNVTPGGSVTYLYIHWFDCFVYFIDRLYQFHESFYSPFIKTFCRSWGKKSIGGREKLIDQAIHWRIDNDVIDRFCICIGICKSLSSSFSAYQKKKLSFHLNSTGYCWPGFLFLHSYRFNGRKLPCILSFFFQAGKSFKRKDQ